MSELDMQVTYNGVVYNLVYNAQSGFYEVELTAPNTRWCRYCRNRI